LCRRPLIAPVAAFFNLIFSSFCKAGATSMFSMWVKAPITKEEIERSSEAYTWLECLAFARTDDVRIRLWTCSHSLRHQHIGKEGFPTRTYQVTVGYRGEIYACTDGSRGRDPDIKITEHDPFLYALFVTIRSILNLNGNQYKTKSGNEGTMKGVWILVDGGYPDWIILQYPTKNSRDPKHISWGKMLESLRKDVERVFGILKQRFVVLKKGLSFGKLKLVDDVFKTCCALHNYLLFKDEQNVDLKSTSSDNPGLVQRMYRVQKRC
jgi:hypothetical protein